MAESVLIIAKSGIDDQTCAWFRWNQFRFGQVWNQNQFRSSKPVLESESIPLNQNSAGIRIGIALLDSKWNHNQIYLLNLLLKKLFII